MVIKDREIRLAKQRELKEQEARERRCVLSKGLIPVPEFLVYFVRLGEEELV